MASETRLPARKERRAGSQRESGRESSTRFDCVLMSMPRAVRVYACVCTNKAIRRWRLCDHGKDETVFVSRGLVDARLGEQNCPTTPVFFFGCKNGSVVEGLYGKPSYILSQKPLQPPHQCSSLPSLNSPNATSLDPSLLPAATSPSLTGLLRRLLRRRCLNRSIPLV